MSTTSTSFSTTSRNRPSVLARAPILTPTSTPSDTPFRPSSRSRTESTHIESTMDTTETDKLVVDEQEAKPAQQTTSKMDTSTATEPTKPTAAKKGKTDKVKHKHCRKTKRIKKSKKQESSSDESSSSSEDEDESTESTSSSETSSSSEDEREMRRKARQKRALKRQGKASQQKRRSKRYEESDSSSESEDSEDSDSDSGSESSADEKRRKKQRQKGKSTRKLRKAKENRIYEDSSEASATDEYERAAKLDAQLAALQLNNNARAGRKQKINSWPPAGNEKLQQQKSSRKKKKAPKRASTVEYKRVDQLWDNTIHNYKLTESAEDQVDEFQQFVFTVRRKFDWENKYKNTVVDIKSKLLKEALQEVMKDVKGVSLVEDQPSLDPNMLFLYLEELRTYSKKTLKTKVKAEKKRKIKKRIKLMAAHCKVLVKYLDEDYEETKRTLYPMLEAGNITFDLLWALFKPNTFAYTTTYGSVENPRCFKVDYATKESSFMRGEWYCVEGRYLEYDGKSFGLGEFESDVEMFKGPRKITSLGTYPLQYHKDPEGLKKQLIERGKQFVALEGMNYRFHNGLAFMKKKKGVGKVNINGRVMIDPAIFRRINANYPISLIKPKDPDEAFLDDESEAEDDCSDCCGDNDSDGGPAIDGEGPHLPGEETKERTRLKVVRDKDNKSHIVQVPVDEDGVEIKPEQMEKLSDGVDPVKKREFTEEELLIASPVVLGFAFSEKLWLEFSLAGVKEIEWNAGAFESLVLPDNQKNIVKALVESHKFHAAKTIDDVVQGKGKGLVAVLHGSPGTGKTLTAEGIAELLKCPLYMVSAGELGTDPRILEHELQKILDIAHSWGAVLLLDEADVFLEKRQIHDIHRNALVSIFLRLLEYFQGILFLTTNRVETFDDAFQSRIHVALRYGELTVKAKKAVWKMFLEKVRTMEGAEIETFRDQELELLARNNLNGRQIKNAVRTAQALAVNEGTKLSMLHIKRVLEVAESFEQDLKGGTGYKDAMRSYT